MWQDVARAATANPAQNSVALVVEPRLSNTAKFTGASLAAWYLFGGPADAPVIVGFLNGRQSPTVEAMGLEADVNRLAYSWRVYQDYGAALNDYRAAVKSKGAA